jgi:hypothetical protein
MKTQVALASCKQDTVYSQEKTSTLLEEVKTHLQVMITPFTNMSSVFSPSEDILLLKEI